jgi:hypothetical protein
MRGIVDGGSGGGSGEAMAVAGKVVEIMVRDW